VDEVAEVAAPAVRERPLSVADDQHVGTCTAADGVKLAWSTVGDGPPLVKAANWLSHLAYDWVSPVWRHWWRDLSRHHQLLRYDERGCGLSDWDVEDISFEAWVHDLETVVDAAGLERFALLGVSQGGPVAIAYAVRHPERVSGLILYGTYAQGWRARADSPETLELGRIQTELVRAGWGSASPVFRRVFAMQFMPTGSREQWDDFDELQRRTTSPENALRFMETFGALDVAHLAPQVQVPTLVLHARQDARAPVELGRRLAALIPGSRFCSLGSDNHLLLENEPAWPRFVHEVEEFLAGLA
jgi:pimeloyl-ACP methyl ester carboxylesterase